MTTPGRIYLDNAATSWPKPERVYRAVDQYMRHVGAAAGRGAYREAIEVDRQVEQARASIARLIGVRDSRRIAFTASGTDGLNTALSGLLTHHDHVVTSVCEHNSVLRPLHRLQETRGIQVTTVPCDRTGIIRAADVLGAVTPRTRVVVLIHASNVTGALQPLAEIGHQLRRERPLFLIDAAQSLGHLPLDADELGADLIAAPGHKGLLGPLGTGILYVGPRAETQIASFRQGGTGTESDQPIQPESLPEKFEAGNLNVPGIIGLAAGASYLLERGIERLRCEEMRQTSRLIEGLDGIRGVCLHGPRRAEDRVGVVSFQVDDCPPQQVAAILDSSHRIQARAGIHCAPLMHRQLGTLDSGGTVRFSLGPMIGDDDLETAVRAVESLAAAVAAR